MSKNHSNIKTHQSQLKICKQATIALRGYQQSLIRLVYEKWDKGLLKILMQLPTGGGKTIILAAIARNFYQRQEPILVIAHTEELIFQLRDALESACGVMVGVIKAGVKANPDRLIQVASVQTLRNRELPPAALVIIDESQHGVSPTYRQIIESYQDSYILGVTATPCRTDGSGFDDLFNALTSITNTRELIEQGHLCNYKLIADPNAINTKGIGSTAGDYNNRELADSVDAVELAGNLIGAYKLHAIGKKCVVFAINCSHSLAIAKRYAAEGIPAEHLDGETPEEERKAIIERFRTGETRVLCNVNIVTEGFNLPDIEVVQVARPTKSLSLWLQMVGRGLRTAEGKDVALILDHTDNFARLGMPDAPHIWTLEGVTIAKERLKRNRRTHLVERDETEIIETDAVVLQEVKAIDVEKLRLDHELKELDRLFEIAAHNQYRPSWAAFKFLELKPSLNSLKVCAKKLGYKPSWAKYKFKEISANLPIEGEVA
ncbi:MAG: hypothetical protein AUK48_14595 [Oscillatoriales cyanobacterium CG2_30_44_21]|nr:MAG: hypothetical protein AUK48_14595 [Oscillatoriales cyanobacterium CG2_30_44_21]